MILATNYMSKYFTDWHVPDEAIKKSIRDCIDLEKVEEQFNNAITSAYQDNCPIRARRSTRNVPS